MLTVYGTQAAALVELVLRRPTALPIDAIGGVALVAMVAGLALRTWAIATLGRWFTLEVGVEPAQRLVQAGPYRLVRHPSYAGALLAFAASAVLLHAWVTAAIGTLALYRAFRRRIDCEERCAGGQPAGLSRLRRPDRGDPAAPRRAGAPALTEADPRRRGRRAGAGLVPEVAGHAVARDAPSLRGGSWSWQIPGTWRMRQRVWKWHPAGGRIGLGTSPSSRMRWRLTSGSGIGTADSRASV